MVWEGRDAVKTGRGMYLVHFCSLPLTLSQLYLVLLTLWHPLLAQ